METIKKDGQKIQPQSRYAWQGVQASADEMEVDGFIMSAFAASRKRVFYRLRPCKNKCLGRWI
jgi:hypothetical protein